MKAVNVDDVLKILYKYGKYIFVTDEKRYSTMVDEIANLKALEQESKTGRWINADKLIERILNLPKNPNGYSKVYDEADIVNIIEAESEDE